MENSRLFAGLEPARPGRIALPRRPTGALFKPRCEADLRIARMTSANLLLIGDEPVVSQAIGFVNTHRGQPPIVRRGNGGLCLPVPAATGATLIVHDVDRLSADDQDEFLLWLDASRGRTRVISSAAEPLFPAVFAGAFSPELYYRLNTLRVDLRS